MKYALLTLLDTVERIERPSVRKGHLQSSRADFPQKMYNYGIDFKIEFSLSFNVKYSSFSDFRKYITTNVIPVHVRIRNGLKMVFSNNSLLIYNAM